jgi:hypothetical protein
VLFVFIWLSVFYLGTRLAHLAHPFILCGVLLVSTFFLPTIENQSDALFLGFSSLAVGKVLTFRRSGILRELVFASVFAGFGALSRAEAILLLLILPLIAILLASPAPRWRRVACAALPALAVVAVYAAMARVSTGAWGVEFAGKSWESFEVNQPASPGVDPVQETHRLFGTGEENGYSVVRAALRNPAEFSRRVAVRATALPNLYLSFFDKRVGVAVAFFAVWGGYALLRKREGTLLWVGCLWAIPTATSLAFLSRHFIPQVAYLPLVLAPVGLTYATSPETSRWARLAVVGSMVAFAIYSLLGAKPAFLFAMMMLLTVAGIVWLLRDRPYPSDRSPVVALLLTLAAGLVLRGPFDFPDFTKLGTSASEQAVHFLQRALPPGTRVVAFEPIVPIAARMEPIEPPPAAEVGGSASALCNWLSAQSVGAVVVDGQLRANHPDLVLRMERQLGRGVEIGFTSDPATISTFVVTEQCN